MIFLSTMTMQMLRTMSRVLQKSAQGLDFPAYARASNFTTAVTVLNPG